MMKVKIIWDYWLYKEVLLLQWMVGEIKMIFSPNIILKYEDLIINPLEQTVFYKNSEIKFTNREFQILYLLLQYQGIVLSKKQIYEQIADDDKVDYHTIEITISRIRKKLKEHTGRSDLILTVRDRGYKFRK